MFTNILVFHSSSSFTFYTFFTLFLFSLLFIYLFPLLCDEWRSSEAGEANSHHTPAGNRSELHTKTFIASPLQCDGAWHTWPYHAHRPMWLSCVKFEERRQGDSESFVHDHHTLKKRADDAERLTLRLLFGVTFLWPVSHQVTTNQLLHMKLLKFLFSGASDVPLVVLQWGVPFENWDDLESASKNNRQLSTRRCRTRGRQVNGTKSGCGGEQRTHQLTWCLTARSCQPFLHTGVHSPRVAGCL